MRLAEAAAAAGSAHFALRLLDDEPMLGPDWQDRAPGDDGSPSPLHLLTHLQGAALLAQLGDAGGALNPKPVARPAPENPPADGAAGDALFGSGTAPAAARRLLTLMEGLVRPGGAGGCQPGGPAGAQAQAAAGAAAATVALEPFLGAMPAAVCAAAARGCLLLARWAQVSHWQSSGSTESVLPAEGTDICSIASPSFIISSRSVMLTWHTLDTKHVPSASQAVLAA